MDKLARIYKTQQCSADKLKPLKIDDRNIRFFRPVIFDCSQFFIDKSGKWWLSFFCGSDYQQDFCIDFHSLPEYNSDKSSDSKEVLLKDIRSACLSYEKYGPELSKLVFIYTDKPDSDDCAFEKASLVIRGTKSIKRENFYEATSHFGHVDGRGLSFVTSISHQYHYFERQVLLLCLAYAYMGAIALLSDRLSMALRSEDVAAYQELTSLYNDAAKFSAGNFFMMPVIHTNPGLTNVWKRIDTALGVSNVNDELLRKINEVHHILSIKDAEQKRRAEKKQNTIFTALGLIIGFLSLIEIFI